MNSSGVLAVPLHLRSWQVERTLNLEQGIGDHYFPVMQTD